MEKRQENYAMLYLKVQNEMIENGYTKSLLDLCSVGLDRNGNDKQINLEFLDIELNTLRKLKNCFDNYSTEFGFQMNYTNLSSDLRVFS